MPAYRYPKTEILEVLEESAPVLRTKELYAILEEHREDWNLPKAATPRRFINYLRQSLNFREARFSFYGRKELLYYREGTPELCIINAIRPNAYFSHYTALQLHDLTEQNPKVVYLNSEQSKKRLQNAEIRQDAVDRAFSRKQRISKTRSVFSGKEICLLSGKHTQNAGVIELPFQDRYTLRVAGLERTLIDIAVRPVYAGGVTQVLESYRRAADRVSVNALLGLLTKLGYSYPYHQAVGFYMDAAGNFTETQVSLVERIPRQLNFYLSYGMEETEFSRKWKVFFPRGLDRAS